VFLVKFEFLFVGGGGADGAVVSESFHLFSESFDLFSEFLVLFFDDI
jgi:hypothetical protein